MKRTLIGIAVAVFLMLAGSVAYAQPGRGRDGDRNGWRQDRQSDRYDRGHDRRNDERSRQNDRWDRRDSSERSDHGRGHDGHVRPAPNPAPAPAPVVAPRPPATWNPGSRGRMGRHQPITQARLAAIRAELRLHSQRLATLYQIRRLARRTGNRSALTLVNTVIVRENFRHQTRIASLMPTYPSLAHRQRGGRR